MRSLSLALLARPLGESTEGPGRLLVGREGVPGIDDDGVISLEPTSLSTKSSSPSLRAVED